MKTLKLNKKDIQEQVKKLRNNLDNLFILGFYTKDEYKLYLDELENTELYLLMNN